MPPIVATTSATYSTVNSSAATITFKPTTTEATTMTSVLSSLPPLLPPVNLSSMNGEEISTIFVIGFPEDMLEREFQNMFIFSPGFEAATLKIPSKDQEDDMMPNTNSSSSSNNNAITMKKQIIGFAKFRTRMEALEAKDIISGRKVDAEKGSILKAEMAKKNLHTKRGLSSSEQASLVLQQGISIPSSTSASSSISSLSVQPSSPSSLAPVPTLPSPTNPLKKQHAVYEAFYSVPSTSTASNVMGLSADFYYSDLFSPSSTTFNDTDLFNPSTSIFDVRAASVGDIFNTTSSSSSALPSGFNSSHRLSSKNIFEMDKDITYLSKSTPADHLFLSPDPSSFFSLQHPYQQQQQHSHSHYQPHYQPHQHHHTSHLHHANNLASSTSSPIHPHAISSSTSFSRASSHSFSPLASLSTSSCSTSGSAKHNTFTGGNVPGLSSVVEESGDKSPVSYLETEKDMTLETSSSVPLEINTELSQRVNDLGINANPISLSIVPLVNSSFTDNQSNLSNGAMKTTNTNSSISHANPPIPSFPMTTMGNNTNGSARNGSNGVTMMIGSSNPADQNPPCNTLYVGNLPPKTNEDELKQLFSKCVGYKRLSFRHKSNGPMCFVEFIDVMCATQALQELYGNPLSNSVKGGIRLSFSKNPLGVRQSVSTTLNVSSISSSPPPASSLSSSSSTSSSSLPAGVNFGIMYGFPPVYNRRESITFDPQLS